MISTTILTIRVDSTGRYNDMYTHSFAFTYSTMPRHIMSFHQNIPIDESQINDLQILTSHAYFTKFLKIINQHVYLRVRLRHRKWMHRAARHCPTNTDHKSEQRIRTQVHHQNCNIRTELGNRTEQNTHMI